MKDVFLIPAEVESVQFRISDRTWKIVLGTQDLLSPADKAQISGIAGESLFVAFKKNPFATAEIEVMSSLKADFEDKRKTPSQRLRAVFFRLWEKDNEKYDDFNLYYEYKVEKLITHYKGLLD